MQGGKLKLGTDGLLPLNNTENFPNGTVSLVNDAHRVPDNQLFATGDVRGNENIELTSLQTVFVREHNRVAARLATQNPRLTDQELYLRARSIVVAEIQAITFNEWLPAVLGDNAMSRYTGYNPRANPGLSNEFSTAAFRFGHSLLGDDVEFLDNDGLEVAEPMELKNAFFNPTVFQTQSVDSIFKYLASDPASEFDTNVVNGVRTNHYEIRVTKDPSGTLLSTPVSRVVDITRGNQLARNVDLPIGRPAASPAAVASSSTIEELNATPPVQMAGPNPFDLVFAQLEDERRRIGR